MFRFEHWFFLFLSLEIFMKNAQIYFTNLLDAIDGRSFCLQQIFDYILEDRNKNPEDERQKRDRAYLLYDTLHVFSLLLFESEALPKIQIKIKDPDFLQKITLVLWCWNGIHCNLDSYIDTVLHRGKPIDSILLSTQWEIVESLTLDEFRNLKPDFSKSTERIGEHPFGHYAMSIISDLCRRTQKSFDPWPQHIKPMFQAYLEEEEKKKQEKEEQRIQLEFYRKLIPELEAWDPSEEHHPYYRYGYRREVWSEYTYPNVWLWEHKNCLPLQGFTTRGGDKVISDRSFVQFYQNAEPISKEEFDKWVKKAREQDDIEDDIDYYYSSPGEPMEFGSSNIYWKRECESRDLLTYIKKRYL